MAILETFVLETFLAEPPPLTQDAAGTVHVGGTRVTLDTVVEAWEDGATAEEIVQRYDALALADVHSALSYYLRHRAEVHSYLDRRQADAAAVRRENERRSPPDALRARLQNRRDAGKQA